MSDRPPQSPITDDDVHALENFAVYREMFPAMVGNYPFGSLRQGVEHLETELQNAKATDDASTSELYKLVDLYDKAIDYHLLLHGSSLLGNARRLQSKSDEHGHEPEVDRISTSNPNKTLHEISRKILHEEIHYYHIQQQKKLELQNLALDVELLKAIEIANRSILLNHLGDYLAALCSDFKNSTEFSKPSQRKKWKFLDHSKYTDLIDCYDKEQQAIEAGLESIDSSPLTKSLHLAHKYLNGKYSSVDEIVTILRAYADRNKMVHSVGPYFQEGNHIGLRQAILRDARNIPFLGNDSASKSFRLEAKQTLDIVVRRFFSKWSWEMDGYAEPSIDMVSLRQAFEAQQQKKDPRVGRQSFEVLEEEAKLRKADDTRQKSMSEEERQKENIDFEARCKQALEICAQDGTALVQDVLKELMSKLKTTQHDLETTKDNIKVTANCAASLLEGAKQTKEEHKEKMRKTKEKHEKEIREKDERISELVSEHGVKK